MFKAEVVVMLKDGVLDPQGKAVKGGLAAMGYKEVADVRVGKYVLLELDASDQATATARVEEMSRRLLANPVIENFRIKILEA